MTYLTEASVRCAVERGLRGRPFGCFRELCRRMVCEWHILRKIPWNVLREVCRRHIVRKLPKDEPHLRDLVVGYADVSVKRASLARVPLFLQSGRLGVILTLLCRENSERKGNIDT